MSLVIKRYQLLTLIKVVELHLITTSDVEELSATLGLGYSFGNDMTSLNINYEANAK